LDFSIETTEAGRHVAPSRHIIPIPSQTFFGRTPKCCVLNGEATTTNLLVIGLNQAWLKPIIYIT